MIVALCKLKPNFQQIYAEPIYNSQLQPTGEKTAQKFRSIINNHLSSRNDIESIVTDNINENDEIGEKANLSDTDNFDWREREQQRRSRIESGVVGLSLNKLNSKFGIMDTGETQTQLENNNDSDPSNIHSDSEGDKQSIKAPPKTKMLQHKTPQEEFQELNKVEYDAAILRHQEIYKHKRLLMLEKDEANLDENYELIHATAFLKNNKMPCYKYNHSLDHEVQNFASFEGYI